MIFLPSFDLVSRETTKAQSAIFTHETRSAEKMFRLVSLFLGEKLCLKLCTVINKVIENRFYYKEDRFFC
jgi:predicted component of type VI protein secretion system